MITTATSRADLHCHSTASELSKLGVQRSLGLPECATPPEEVLALAERRGMDFVTITDHDTIAGAQQIADDPRVFLSEELTVWFRGEAQAVHVLCYGITPDDHEWLQAHNTDVEACAAYLHESGIACALAHPFYAVEAPLTPRHRRRLAELFPVWEVRNGSRARELNAPAAVYIETHGGTGVGGTDDHAGVDIGRTWTETPVAATWQEFLAHIRAGEARAAGEQGSAAKWAHAAMALAIRSLGRPGADGEVGRPDPGRVATILERVMFEGDKRSGGETSEVGPDDARALLEHFLGRLGLDMSTRELLAHMQEDDFTHAGLFRRARAVHERDLAAVAERAVAAATRPAPDVRGIATDLFDACVSALPYAPAAAFLGREKQKLVVRESEPLRVALVADGVGGMHGVTHTLDELRARGVPGFDVEVIGTDPHVDRRLSAVCEVEVPFYPGLSVGVPSIPAIVETLAEGRYDLVHLVSPGPSGVAAAAIARLMQVPVVGSYHTELAAYAGLRSADPQLETYTAVALGAFYDACAHVLSPSPQSDGALEALGIDAGKVGRWDRGVDLSRFGASRRDEALLPGAVNVLYAGRLTEEKGVGLLADAFLAARAQDERLHLVLAGGGPEEEALRARLGDSATFLGWQEGNALAATYASADCFLFASRTDTFGQVLLEAQASGLPVVAVAEGGPVSLIEDGESGLLRESDAGALAQAVLDVTRSELLHGRLARGGEAAVRERTWERALAQLAEGYRRTLAASGAEGARQAA